MSKEIGDETFEFLKFEYDRHVAEFLDDPDGMCGVDPEEIVGHYEKLVRLGEDIALAIGGYKKPKAYFWLTVRREKRTRHEIDRLKTIVGKHRCAKQSKP